MGALVLAHTGFLTIVQWRQPKYGGYTRWLCSGPLGVLSLFLLSLRPNAPDWVCIIAANAVLVLAAILQFEGAREFRGLPPRRWLVYAGGVVTIGGLAFFTYGVPNLNARAALMSAFLAAVFLSGSIALLSAIPPMHRLGLRLTGLLFGLCAATLMVRGVYLSFGPTFSDLFPLSGVHGAILLALSVQISLFPIGFIILADERVISDLKEAKERAESLQTSLRDGEERLRLATQSASVGVFDADVIANRSVWSPMLCALLGAPAATTPTMETVVGFIHPDDRARFIGAVAALIDSQGDGKFSGEFRIRRAQTGETRWMTTFCQTFFEGTGDNRRAVRMTGVMMDITDRKLREEHDRLLNELSAVWMRERDMETLVRTVADAVAHHLGINFVTLSALMPDAAAVSPDVSSASGPLAEDADPFRDLTGEARSDLRSGRSVVVNDVAKDPRTAFANDKYCAKAVRAVVIVPLFRGGVLKSTLNVHTLRERTWRSDEVRLLEDVAARLWSALERAHTEEALRRSEERHEFLLRLSDTLRPLTDARDMQEAAVRLLGEHLNVNRVTYSDVDGDNYIVRLSYANGVAPSSGSGRLSAIGEALVESYLSGGPVLVDNMHTDPRFTDVERARLRGKDIAAFATVMLLKAGRSVASFCVHNATPRVWTTAEVDLIRDVGERTWDAIQRATTEIALRSAEARFRTFLANSPTIAWVKDEEGRYVYLSPTCEKRFGLRLEDWQGKTDFDIWPKAVAEEFSRNDRDVLATDKPLEVLGSAPNPDGTVSWWLSNKFSFSDASGCRYVGGMGVDVTDRKQAEEALRTADRRKNEFLAILAHELRNPLAALTMGLQLARRNNGLEPGLKRTLDMMDRQLSQLLRLIDDLLDIGRISTGKIALQLQPLTLPEVISSGMEVVQAMIEARRHEVAIQIQPGQHSVRGDSARLKQVIANLIENAAKYTEPGGRIRVSLSHENGTEVVSVEDTGIGIPADELSHVFDLFSQVRVHQGKTTGGLGIGLAIVRTLVELHGGAVVATSAGLGRGSTFTVRLPALNGATATQEREDQSQAVLKGSQSGRRVLIVDDNEDAATSLAEFLNLEGHETWIAHDGLRAIEIAKAIELDLVLMDLGMPGLDGIETAKRIRTLPGCERLHMAACTGWGQESDRARTQEAGFDWHLVKPIDTTFLREVVVKLEPDAAIKAKA